MTKKRSVKKPLNPHKIKLIIFINFFLNIFRRHLESLKKKSVKSINFISQVFLVWTVLIITDGKNENPNWIIYIDLSPLATNDNQIKSQSFFKKCLPLVILAR